MKRFAVVLAALLFVGGCAPHTDEARAARAGQHVTEIRLQDGTRCAVLYAKVGYAGMGGISCDWSTP